MFISAEQIAPNRIAGVPVALNGLKHGFGPGTVEQQRREDHRDQRPQNGAAQAVRLNPQPFSCASLVFLTTPRPQETNRFWKVPNKKAIVCRAFGFFFPLSYPWQTDFGGKNMRRDQMEPEVLHFVP